MVLLKDAERRRISGKCRSEREKEVIGGEA